MKFVAIFFVIAAFFAGWFAQPYFKHTMEAHGDSAMAHTSIDVTMNSEMKESGGKKKPLYWVAPMDRNYRRDKPGKSPMGMDLVPVYEEEGGQRNDGGVTISATMEHNLGVRTAIVDEGPFDLSVKAVGTIAFNEDRLIHIHSRVEGWIEKTYVKSAGESVKKGQRLFELYSPQLVNAQEEYLAALRSNNRILQKASKSRLISLGLTNSQISRLEKRASVSQFITQYAGQSGVVASLGVREGMFIKPSLEIMTIGALDEVWLIAEVFERHAGWVKKGQRAEISVPALPGKVKSGVVDYIYPVLDQKSRTLQVRLRLPSDDGLLKPNMFADVKLLASVGEQVISIPREAVIRTGNHSRVVLAEGDGRYRPAFIVPGVESDEKVQVLEGLKPGQRVVISAQFLIDSESNIDVALAALEEQKQQAATPQQVLAVGEIKEVMADARMLSIVHDPIPEWQWPVMNMMFSVTDQQSFDGLKVGQRVSFKLSETEDGDYIVDDIQPLN